MRLAFEGTQGRAPSSGHHLTTGARAYKREDVVEAVARCWRVIGLDPEGPGPSQAEYLEWVRLARRAGWQSGNPTRLPDRMAVSRLWAEWDRLREAAREMLQT